MNFQFVAQDEEDVSFVVKHFGQNGMKAYAPKKEDDLDVNINYKCFIC
jgi:hypothetical protein